MKAALVLCILLIAVSLVSCERDADDEYEDREPLQPDDGIVNPEVGLKRNERILSPSSFETLAHLGHLYKFLGSRPTAGWWKGPNVCVEREESTCLDDDTDVNTQTGFSTILSGSFNIQACVEYTNRYECTEREQKHGKTRIVAEKYECCYGFQLQNRKECVKVELLPLIETIEKLNGTVFLTVSKDLVNTLSTENITVFMPNNEAFQEFSDLMLLSNQVELYIDPSRKRRSAQGISSTQLALGHIVEGFNDIRPETSFTSMFENSTLQMQLMKGGLRVNCAQILASNIQATNGIVHIIDRVLMPVTKTITEILNDVPSLSIFYKLLEKNDLLKDLEGEDTWTIMVPSNDAFEKIDFITKENLQKTGGCAKNILRNHMISEPVCSVNILTEKLNMVKNILGSFLPLTVPDSSSDKIEDNSMEKAAFLVGTAKVTTADIVATNGIIHIIDEVSIPLSVTPLTDMLLEKNLTKFHTLISKAGMLDEVQNISNATLFIPTDKAIDEFANNSRGNSQFVKKVLEYDEKANGPMDVTAIKDLRQFILHHIVQGAIQSCEMENNEMLKVMNEDSELRINLYSTYPLAVTYNQATVDCARLVHFDEEQCDNILHQLDKPLIKHHGSIAEQIAYFPELSMLHKILIDTETYNILKETDDITFLAPTNAAFKNVLKVEYEELMSNKNLVDAILVQHVVRGVTCCELYSIRWPFTTFVSSFNNVRLEVSNNQIGSAPITLCDQMANNGVIHLTNKIMFPRKWSSAKNRGNVNFDILLFGV